MDQSPDINKSLYSIISTVKSNGITDVIKNFFETIINNIQSNDNKYLTICCLIHLMDLLELSLWEQTKNNLEEKYKEEITEIIRNHFNDIDFDDNKNKKIYLSIFILKKWT